MYQREWSESCSVVPNSSRPHGLQPTRLLHPWDFPGKSTGVGCHCLPHLKPQEKTHKNKENSSNKMEKLRILSRGGAWATRKKKYGWYGGEWFISWGSGVNQRRQRQPTPVLLPGKSHEQRSLVGCSPRGQEESDMTEQLSLHSLWYMQNTHISYALMNF